MIRFLFSFDLTAGGGVFSDLFFKRFLSKYLPWKVFGTFSHMQLEMYMSSRQTPQRVIYSYPVLVLIAQDSPTHSVVKSALLSRKAHCVKENPNSPPTFTPKVKPAKYLCVRSNVDSPLTCKCIPEIGTPNSILTWFDSLFATPSPFWQASH
jgi:hypothetical protein